MDGAEKVVSCNVLQALVTGTAPNSSTVEAILYSIVQVAMHRLANDADSHSQ